MDDDVDTEILLASLASLLEPDVPDTTTLLTTLVECNGNVEAAAQALQASSSSSAPISSSSATISESVSNKNRKRNAEDLDRWLTSTAEKSKPLAKKKKPVSEAKTSLAKPLNRTTNKPVSADSGKPIKPVDLMTVLKMPPSKPTKTKHPPLTLSNPQMVAEHTPCTLHYNILPPELACELFYTMYDAARSWSRNKWWLFDRVVESPHRTSFFSRIDRPGGTTNKDMQEEAQFWCAKFKYNKAFVPKYL